MHEHQERGICQVAIHATISGSEPQRISFPRTTVHTVASSRLDTAGGVSMARPVKVNPDRPALIKCDNCDRSFGARVRQSGHETEDGSIAWQMDDEHIRCPHCDSQRVRKVGTS